MLPSNTKSAPSALLVNAVVGGTIVGLGVMLAAAARGARDNGSAIAPINATSHILWGESAARVERVDAQHTLVGFALNHGASIFWAGIYEALFGRAAERGDIARALTGGALVAALAYVTDYHVVAKRLTPGWEERVTGRSLAWIFSVIALTLPLRGLLLGPRRPGR